MRVAFDARPAAAAYSRAFQHLRALPGFDQRTVLLAESGSILKQWAGLTMVMTEANVMKGARLRAVRQLGLSRFDGQASPVTITAGVRGQVGAIWRRTKRGIPQAVGVVDVNTSQARFLNRHYRAADWSAIVSSVNAYRSEYPRALSAVRSSQGLARQSVVQIADQLGIDLNKVQGRGISPAGIAKARAAIAANGRTYRNSSGTQAGDTVRFYVAMFTRLPYGGKIGMDRQLAGVLSGRAKYITTSYEKGVFDSARQSARAFPNILRVAA